MDINQPVTNPALSEALRRMREDFTTENQNLVITEVMTASFLAPAEIQPLPDPPGPAGSTVVQENTTISFQMIENTEGERFFLAFTDWTELHKWQDKEGQQTIVLTFDDYAAMVLGEQSTAAGFVVNPFGANLVMDRKLVADLKLDRDRRAQQ